MAEVKAKKIAAELVENANITVKREMNLIIKQFNAMSQELFVRQQKIERQEKTIKEQEKIINETRMLLFQSTSRQILDKLDIERLEKYLNSNGKDQNNSSDLIQSFMKSENPSSELIEKDKFMENPFGFYTSYISIALRERESILTQDLVRYYQTIISNLEKQIRIKDKEIKGSMDMNSYYAIQINDLSSHIEMQRQKIEDLTRDKEYDKNRYEKQIGDMNTNFMKDKIEQKKENKVYFDILLNEIKVREKIQKLLLKNNSSLKDDIIALKQILMVPKLQYKYIEKMKFESIKSQNEKIMNKEINKIAKNIEISKERHHINRSLSTTKRDGITIKRPSNIDSSPSFGFNEKSRKFSMFFSNKNRISPMVRNDKLPNIMHITSESTRTTSKSFL